MPMPEVRDTDEPVGSVPAEPAEPVVPAEPAVPVEPAEPAVPYSAEAPAAAVTGEPIAAVAAAPRDSGWLRVSPNASWSSVMTPARCTLPPP